MMKRALVDYFASWIGREAPKTNDPETEEDAVRRLTPW